MEPGSDKEWVGELLVLAHRLDELTVRLENEQWQHQRDEGQMLDMQEETVKARRLAHRYRARAINARRDFEAVRQERDLTAAKYNNLLSTLGAAQAAFIKSEAEKSLAVKEALANGAADDVVEVDAD